MKERSLVILVPLPPGVLNPNRRPAHWGVTVGTSRDYAELVKMLALSEKHAWETTPGQFWEPLLHASVQLEFTWPTSKRGPLPDEKNLEAAFKPGIDALTARIRRMTKRGYPIVGAGIIADDNPDCITWLPTVIQRGDEAGVKITVREVR